MPYLGWWFGGSFGVGKCSLWCLGSGLSLSAAVFVLGSKTHVVPWLLWLSLDAMRRGGVNLLKRRSGSFQELSTHESIWKLGRLKESEVESVLLPELKRSEEKLPEALKCFREQKRGDLAFATLNAVREDGTIKLKASHYTQGITACARSKMPQQALELFDDMPRAKVKPHVYSYSAAISACEKGGQWQEALKLFDAMPQSKVQPNVYSYSAAISACEKGGQWQQALMLFDAMPQAKVQPDVISYNSTISACEKGGQWQQALKLFDAMPQAKVQPDVISYSAAISACEKGGQWRQALKLFDAMPPGKSSAQCHQL